MLRALTARVVVAASLFGLLLVPAGPPVPLVAQATTVTLQGVVSASDSSVPRGAEVEVRSRATGASRSAVAGADGAYRMLGLGPDLYDVTVRAIGYRRQRREGVRVVVGQRATLDFTLERGVAELAPTVVTAHRAFEVERTDVSTPVLQEEIERLPLNSRNVLNLAAIAPGIRTFGAEAGRSVPASGALPVAEPRFSNFYVDGLEWKGMYVGQVVGTPAEGSMIPQEAVREFRVYLNSYDAEYTHGAAHVISAVTHRGGNTFEGSLFAFHQNSALVARSSFQTETPAYSRQQIGGNLRGPLVRNRAFFSLSYEGQITDNYIDVVPGRPNANPGIWDRYAGTFKAPHRLHNALLRLTVPIGTHVIDATGALRHVRREGNFGTLLGTRMLSQYAGVVGGPTVTSLHVRDTYASASLVNELSIQLLSLRNNQALVRPGPTLQYQGIQIGRFNFPFRVHDEHLRAVNKTSYVLTGFGGQHVVKTGVEVSRVHTAVYRPTSAEGLFLFPTDTSTLPSFAQIGIGLADPSSTREGASDIDGWIVGAYLQDQWQPVRSLTITAGMRYDADINTLNQNLIAPWAGDTALHRAIGEQFLNTGDRKNDLDNFAPRLAISWDVAGKGRTFLRAGYGVMYDRIPLAGALPESREFGWRTYTFQNPRTTDPAELRRLVAGGGAAVASNIILLKDRLQAPENHQWSVGLGRQVDDRLAINVDYVNQRTRHLYVTTAANLPTRAAPRPIRGYGTITIWDDFGDARFDAVVGSLTYDRRPTRLTVAYTLGWAQSEFGELTVSDYADSAAYVMQRSEGDERHRVVVSGSTRLPFGLDASLLAIVASPRPFLVGAGSDVNQNGSAVDDWPDGIRTHRRDGWDHWYRTVDLRVAKSLPFARGRATVTAEVFNVLNTANHSEYQAVQTLAGYGEPIGDFARRQGQVGLRYQF
jgi:carboxypeptidase family protein